MSKFSKFIEENNVSDLSSRVFKQKLSPSSSGTYTDVLDEKEENAVIKNLIEIDSKGTWRVFVLEYFKHYVPFNSSVDILLDHAENISARDVLKQVISAFSLCPYQAEKLCRLVSKEKNSFNFHLLEAFCRNPHALHVDSGLYLALLSIDEKYTGHADVHVKLAEIYKSNVEKATTTVV